MTRLALAARGLLVQRRDANGVFELRVTELDVKAGEALAVLGPNGAGKSTLLRTLAGLQCLEAGAVERGSGGPVTMVFQKPIVFAGSVEHNLRAALLGLRLPREDVTARVAEALERFGIADFSGRRASTLSGGETRRLALARAFALRPAVLLLDEPFDDLDVAGQESLSIDLRRAIAETDVAVVVVTHDLRRALLLADRIAVLQAGRMVQCDERDQVLNHPRGPAVARVVGMSNLIAGRYEVAPGSVALGGKHRVPANADFANDAPVWLGIRPEHLLVNADAQDAVTLGTASVRHVLSDGITATFTFDWEGSVLRTHLIAGQEVARSLAPGKTATLSVSPENIRVMERSGDEASRIVSDCADSPWFVYVLTSAGAARTYVGITIDPERRLAQHNGERPGGARTTRAGRPWRLAVRYGPFAARGEALRAERQVKRLRGRERLSWRPEEMTARAAKRSAT